MASLSRSLLLLVVLGLAEACAPGAFDAGAARRKANETAVLSHLKRYSTAQSLLLTERGRYAEDLLGPTWREHHGGILDESLVQARYDALSPLPLNGYLFSELANEDPMRAGLAAWPVAPGRSGDKIMMILADRSDGPPDWRIFWAEVGAVEPPLTDWPSPSHLASAFHEIRRRSPREGLREAREVFETHRSGGQVQDPVFGRSLAQGD